jgi:type I restriction enzyme S subunit
MSRGVIDSRLRLYPEQFFTFPVIIPPVIEQKKIADFLDEKCREIDKLVSLQEQMIEELKAYKQSVITEAVTKGLNPDAPMKDSGIDWIGDVPKGWKITQTKRIVLNHLQGYYDADGYVTSGYRLLRITDLLNNGNLTLENAPFVKETPNIMDFILQRGDFCFARTGGAGNFGYVSDDIEPAVFASYLIRFRFIGQNNNFLRYYFLSYSFICEINSLIHGGVNKNIHAENIKETHILLPSLFEQQSIASYLDTKSAEIDSLIDMKQQKIESLKEYKKSVIFEYVTGKKQVV